MKAQNLPHFGIKMGWTRKGRVVCTKPATKDADGKVVPAVFRPFDSISRAKRYMRTGEAFLGDSMDVKIEKGIPPPDGKRQQCGMASVFRKMEVGDSFIWPETLSQDASSISSNARKNGIQVSSRTQPDGTIRVWRIA